MKASCLAVYVQRVGARTRLGDFRFIRALAQRVDAVRLNADAWI